jgi:hypothetical protein
MLELTVGSGESGGGGGISLGLVGLLGLLLGLLARALDRNNLNSTSPRGSTSVSHIHVLLLILNTSPCPGLSLGLDSVALDLCPNLLLRHEHLRRHPVNALGAHTHRAECRSGEQGSPTRGKHEIVHVA